MTSTPPQEGWTVADGESPGGPWRYTAWRPPSLRGAVDHLWAYRGPTNTPGKRVFPNGCVELLISPSESYMELPSRTRRVGAWVSGPSARPALIEQPRHQDCFAARLYPLAARAVFGVPLSTIANRSAALDELIDRGEASALVERCAFADTEARLRMLGAFIEARLRATDVTEATAQYAVTRIDECGGAVRIRDLRAELALSTARLSRTFRDQVGLTPKRYARTVRFRRTLRLLTTCASTTNLARLALDVGYFDQAHMNAEFRALGDLTPRRYLAERHVLGGGATASANL